MPGIFVRNIELALLVRIFPNPAKASGSIGNSEFSLEPDLCWN